VGRLCNGINTQTATWVYHDPTASVTVITNGSLPIVPPTQMVPTNPAPAQPVDIWVKVGYQFQIDTCYIYYTTDGTNPEGAFGVGKGSTKVAQAFWVNGDAANGTIDWWKGTIPGSEQTSGAQIRYKVALFKGGSSPVNTISDADNAKWYGLTQFGITNFNPLTGTAWLHNDLNPSNTATGLSSGFHIVRGRAFLPRSGKSAAYNTFLQTFYYDAQLPSGTVAFPPNGNTISVSTYQVVVRGDSSVTGVDFNIADSDTNNDDAITGQVNGNGLINGSPSYANAAQVTPDPTLSQQYPAYPQEFRFNYVAVPSSGTATITVRLRELSTSVYSNRFTGLTTTVNTRAPANVLFISSPAADGVPLIVSSNSLFYIQACFTPTLTTNSTSLFSLYVNGALQPSSSYILAPVGGINGCPTLRGLLCPWTNFLQGTNVIELDYTNQIVLSSTRIVPVGIRYSTLDSDADGMPDWMEYIAGTNPYDSNSVLRITGIDNDNQLVWESVSNITYTVIATTNFSLPMLPISPLIRASDTTTFWTDDSPDPTNRFYRIQVGP
jgi:hypothetical protein